MSKQIIEAAENYLNIDLSVVPVGKDKRATIKWEQFQRIPLDPAEVARVFENVFGVAIISGTVSDGFEVIDFDAHEKDIDEVYAKFTSDEKVTHLFKKHNICVEKTMRGGYHIIYTYETENREGNQKLANWENGDSMIETRGEGGYTVVYPTPGYTLVQGSIEELPRLLEEERDYLISLAKTFSRGEEKSQETTDKPTAISDATDPVSYFNSNKTGYAKHLLEQEGWKKQKEDTKEKIEYWQRPGKNEDESHSATWGYKDNSLYVFSSSASPFKKEQFYSPFQILVVIRFKGSYRSAFEWIIIKYFSENIPYVRVGTDFFKRIVKVDRFGIERIELKRWTKDEIKDDHSKTYLSNIAHFDDFTIRPDNQNYSPIVNNCYNLYREFPHQPNQGDWRWSKIIMTHIFGEQYDIGMRYLQILYLHPERLLPILVLVSRLRQTGKTTFLNWLNMIFGDNMANVSPDDLISGFNAAYAASNIIAIEETLFEKKITVEKLKALATSKFITVNQKFISQYRMPFFGKIILTSNNEDKFARIDQEEIRFFVRRIGIPQIENHNIEEDLVKEIPAFLYQLSAMPQVNFSHDRTGFLPEELDNDSLKLVKEESKSELCQELLMIFEELFLNDLQHLDEFEVDARAVKEKYYPRNNNIGPHYIRRVLKDEIKATYYSEPAYFHPFENDAGRTGRRFIIKRKLFTNQKKQPKNDVPF